VRPPGEKQIHTIHVPEVGLDGMRRDGREQWGKCGCRPVQVDKWFPLTAGGQDVDFDSMCVVEPEAP